MGVKIAGVALALVGGFMLADVLSHPAGTTAAGSVLTRLWTVSAQGASGQKITQ